MTINVPTEEFFEKWSLIDENLYHNVSSNLRGIVVYENNTYVVLRLQN